MDITYRGQKDGSSNRTRSRYGAKVVLGMDLLVQITYLSLHLLDLSFLCFDQVQFQDNLFSPGFDERVRDETGVHG